MKNQCALLFISLVLSSMSHAGVLSCNGIGDNKGQHVTLDVISNQQVKIDNDLANLDQSFSPRLNSGLMRFEYEQADEGVTEVLVQETLLDGAEKGLIKIQNRGEGFSTSSYYCHL